MESTINKFYNAFSNLDANKMAECYTDDVVFEDPAFGVIQGDQVRNMWAMLCKAQEGKVFKVEFSAVKSEGERGSAHWEAWYDFSKTGRKVHNIIDAQFQFKQGLISKHTDHFDLYRWSKQAMGLQGTVIGWTPFFKKKLNEQCLSLLDKYERSLS